MNHQVQLPHPRSEPTLIFFKALERRFGIEFWVFSVHFGSFRIRCVCIVLQKFLRFFHRCCRRHRRFCLRCHHHRFLGGAEEPNFLLVFMVGGTWAGQRNEVNEYYEDFFAKEGRIIGWPSEEGHEGRSGRWSYHLASQTHQRKNNLLDSDQCAGVTPRTDTRYTNIHPSVRRRWTGHLRAGSWGPAPSMAAHG